MKRTYLITGASKGIGRATAERLAAAGHGVVGIARQGDDPGFPGTLVSADLGDRDQAEAVFKELAGRFEFDGLVNNVGMIKHSAPGGDRPGHLRRHPCSASAPGHPGQPGAAARHESAPLGPHRQCFQPDHLRPARAHRLRQRQGRHGQLHPHLGPGTGAHRHHRQRHRPGSHRDRTVPRQQTRRAAMAKRPTWPWCPWTGSASPGKSPPPWNSCSARTAVT